MANQAELKLTKYQQFEKALGAVADNWSEEMALDGEPGHRPIYLSLAQQALCHVALEQDETASPELMHACGGQLVGPALDGLRVMSLYCHYTALTAGAMEKNIHETAALIRQPASLDPLKKIANQRSKIAGRVETEHGLSGTSYDDGLEQIAQKHYDVVGHCIVAPELDREIVCQKLNTGDMSDGVGCRAEKAGQLEVIFHHVVTICSKDTRLSPASYARGRQLRKNN